MNAHAQTLKPVELGTNFRKVERLAGAIEHTLICYAAIPAYPENERTRANYWQTYQRLLGEMMEAVHD